MLRQLEVYKGNSLRTVMQFLSLNCREFKYISKVAKAVLNLDDEIDQLKARVQELEDRSY